MQELLDALVPRLRAGERFAVGTLVRTFQSAPRDPGASMAVAADGEAIGSVSGGCVEGALHEVCLDVVGSGVPGLHRYGVSDEDAFAVGLTCGGILEVFVQRMSLDEFPELVGVHDSVLAHEPVAIATVVSAGAHLGQRMVVRNDRRERSLGSERLNDAVSADARGLLEVGRSGVLHYGDDGERRGDSLSVFVEVCAPPAHMIVFGAIDFASAAVRAGKFLGYRVTVCDARAVFATQRRFPDADAVVVDWPHRFLSTQAIDARTLILVLTHDPKFDVPLLEVALRTNAAYIGAMGSRRTHERRLADLRERGCTEAELARLSSPIGLDIGARTPEETAISIAAEIIAVRSGGSGSRLRDLEGPIHR